MIDKILTMTKDDINYCYGSWTINVPTLIKPYVGHVGSNNINGSRIHLFDDGRQAVQRYLERVFNRD